MTAIARSHQALRRLGAVIGKEFIQMRRDRLTFGMMIGIPLLQIILFGFAINTDPRHLPTILHAAEPGTLARTLAAAMRNTGYFDIIATTADPRQVDRALALGEAQFALSLPPDLERRLARGERPAVLLEADATDPAATSNAIGALRQIVDRAFRRDLAGSLSHVQPSAPAVTLRIHARYNPEAITQYNIVPGLMGVILTMTMVIITGLAMTRETERGTMENLLATPLRPLEVMVGKIVPYILVGYLQIGLILAVSRFVFRVPFLGSLPLLLASALLFIAANLGVGIMFSTVARNQLQAVQMAFFFFLPSILLSGFMFPFRGMPRWAQSIGEILPLTHFLRVVRGIMLKGNGPAEVAAHLAPVALFTLAVVGVALAAYRRTLDE